MASRKHRPRDDVQASKGVAQAMAGLLFSLPLSNLLLNYVEQREALVVFMFLFAALLVAMREVVSWLSLLDRRVTHCEGFVISVFEFLKIIVLFTAVQMLLGVAVDIVLTSPISLPGLLLLVNILLVGALNFWPYIRDHLLTASLSADDLEAEEE
jgi:hypothetical protein